MIFSAHYRSDPPTSPRALLRRLLFFPTRVLFSPVIVGRLIGERAKQTNGILSHGILRASARSLARTDLGVTAQHQLTLPAPRVVTIPSARIGAPRNRAE